jgi:apolipoprotein N-acyltransferase
MSRAARSGKKEPSGSADSRIERKRFLVRLTLSMVSGVLLGFSFPPSQLGILACFGLVPLLIALADVTRTRALLGYSYVAFFLFHLITINWTGGFEHGHDVYMMIAGGVTMVVHPIFYFLPLLAYHWCRKCLGDVPALIGLPFFWVAYEYSHTLSEWSFPWLTLGNSQSYDVTAMQFISFTGVLGLSFWVLLMNVVAYVLYSLLAQRRTGRGAIRAWVTVAALVALFLAPKVYGWFVLESASHESRTEQAGQPNGVTVGIVQPNLDPWDKWSMQGYQILELYLHLTDSLVKQCGSKVPDLVLWPETAVPYYLLDSANRGMLNYLEKRLADIGVPVLTGLANIKVYADSTKAPPSAKRFPPTGQRYDTFNAAALIQPGERDVQWYGKMKMVPFAERVPYADLFYFFDFLRWNVGIGGWQIGPDTTVFRVDRSGHKFSAMICYESTYPDFVSAFVRRGAQFITIITIDSWWGRMSGAFQHKQFALFRAVENRRWVARCALGGISCFIDPYGRTYDATELFSRALLCRTIEARDEVTFYAAHGDWLGTASVWVAGALLAACVGQIFYRRKRESEWLND